MKKLGFYYGATLAMSLMNRIKQMNTSNNYCKESCRKEIEDTEELLNTINSNDLYVEDRDDF